MHSNSQRLVLLSLALFLSSCGGGDFSPSEERIVVASEMAELEVRADQGDMQAVRRLIDHYATVDGNGIEVRRWRSKARELGDAFELHAEAERLGMEAIHEGDLKLRAAKLLEALELATKASRASSEPSHQQLVDNLQLELWKLTVRSYVESE